MRKWLLTLGIVFTMLLPILQNSQALVFASTEKSAEEQYAYQLNGKMLGGAAALATDEPAEYELLWEPNRAKAAFHAVALSPDKKLLAIGGGHLSGDNEIHLYYWTGHWTHIWSAGDGIIEGSVLALAIDDMDGDGFFEVVAGSAGGKIYVYALRTGNPDYIEQKAAEVYQLVWKSSDEITHRIWSIIIDDLDEDMVKELIIGAGDGIHVFEYLTRSGYRNRLGYSQAYTEVWSSGNTVKRVRAVATGDSNGDGFKEIIAGSEDHRVYVFENVLDEWSAYPPHADNAYVLKWDSGRQLFGPIQALAVGDLNPATPSDEIVVSAYGHGVFVFEKAADVQLVSTLLIAETTISEAIFLSPASQALGEPAPSPNQVGQPIIQPIVQPIETQPIVVQPVPIQPVLPIQPSQPIQLVEMPTGAPGLAVTYLKDRTMTMTKLFRPLEPWEAPEDYGGPPVPYPIDIYTDWATGSLGGVQDPYEGIYPLEANSAMTRKPDGILGRIPTEGNIILDFGQFEPITGGGNSAPDLTILLGIGPEEPIYQAIGTLQPVESIIPVGQMQPLKLAEPTAKIAPIEPTELVVGGEVLPIEEVPQAVQSKTKSASGGMRALSVEPIQPDQIIFQPIFQPIFLQLSPPIEPVQTIQPFLTPYSPIRTVDAFQPISPSISKATPVSVTQINPIQPLLPSDAIVDVLKKQSVEIAISQDGENFTIVPSDFIKEAEWTLGSQRLTKLGMEVLPSYVIDLDPVLVATQWDSIRYLYVKNTGDVNIYVDTAYGILYRPLAETLSIHLTNMNLARPSGDIIPSEYEDQDVIALGTQDGRLIFYDYQGVQQAPRIYDTYEDSVFSLGTGIWNFISITDSPTQQGLLCGTYPAIHWIEVFQKNIGGTIYWRANNTWDTLERLKEWTFGEAVEIGDPDGDNQDEILAGSWDNNIYLFENIYNGTYYNAWSSPDLTHVETGELLLYTPLVISGFAQASSRIQSVLISTTAGIPFTYRLYDDTIDMIVGDTDGDEAAEIIVATTRSILVFENRATQVNPNLYELVWRGDFQIDAKYEITALSLGDDLDGDGAPEIIVLVGNKLYVLESAELYVPPELVQPYQPVLNITNPKLGPIYAEPIDVSPIVTQPDQPIVVQPIIPQPVEPIVQPQPVFQPELQQKSQQQIPIIQPSKLQPATQLKLVYNHYIITSVLDVPNFDNTIVTRMITEDLDLDGHGEIILAGVSLTGVYHLAMMTRYNGIVRCLEAVANDDYREKWTVTPPFGVTAIAVDDQDGNGRKELICGSFGIIVFEHTGADDGIALKQSAPTDTIGWVGALGVGNSDGDNRREILVAATNVSESGPNLPKNIISVLELKPGTIFIYELVYNTAFREPINVGDMAIGDMNNNGYDEIICSAPGGFIFSYEYSSAVEVTEIFMAAQFAYPVYSPVYREVTMVEEAEQLQSAEEMVPLYNATLIQQPFYPIG